jgi:hypothetical protein
VQALVPRRPGRPHPADHRRARFWRGLTRCGLLWTLSGSAACCWPSAISPESRNRAEVPWASSATMACPPTRAAAPRRRGGRVPCNRVRRCRAGQRGRSGRFQLRSPSAAAWGNAFPDPRCGSAATASAGLLHPADLHRRRTEAVGPHARPPGLQPGGLDFRLLTGAPFTHAPNPERAPNRGGTCWLAFPGPRPEARRWEGAAAADAVE